MCVSSLALAQGAMDRQHVPDLSQPDRSRSSLNQVGVIRRKSDVDPFGHDIVDSFGEYLKAGFDIRPTIAVTRAHRRSGDQVRVTKTRSVEDSAQDGQANITKAAVEPVWYYLKSRDVSESRSRS